MFPFWLQALHKVGYEFCEQNQNIRVNNMGTTKLQLQLCSRNSSPSKRTLSTLSRLCLGRAVEHITSSNLKYLAIIDSGMRVVTYKSQPCRVVNKKWKKSIIDNGVCLRCMVRTCGIFATCYQFAEQHISEVLMYVWQAKFSNRK